MEFTKNYGLPQYQGNDLTDWYQFNPAFQTIDKTMKANADAVATAQETGNSNTTAIGNLTESLNNTIDRVRKNEIDINDNSQQISLHTTHLNEHDTALQLINSEISTIQQEIGTSEEGSGSDGTLRGDVSVLKNDMTDVKGRLTTAEQNIVTNTDHIGALAGLKTNKKDNLVNAINEVFGNTGEDTADALSLIAYTAFASMTGNTLYTLGDLTPIIDIDNYPNNITPDLKNIIADSDLTGAYIVTMGNVNFTSWAMPATQEFAVTVQNTINPENFPSFRTISKANNSIITAIDLSYLTPVSGAGTQDISVSHAHANAELIGGSQIDVSQRIQIKNFGSSPVNINGWILHPVILLLLTLTDDGKPATGTAATNVSSQVTCTVDGLQNIAYLKGAGAKHNPLYSNMLDRFTQKNQE